MEDQEIMEHFAENKQGYVIDNINAVAGSGIGVGDVLGNTEEIMGVKYDEQLHEQHDVGDDDELKYVKEVQQSEKQHLENVGDGRNRNELAEKENDVDNYEVGLKEENINNEKHSATMPDNIQFDNMFGQMTHMEQKSEEMSSTDVSDTVYSGDNMDVENPLEHFEIGKVDDSSLLMANTTTTANSEPSIQAFESDKENILPLVEPFVGGQNEEHSYQANNFEQMSSQLNPDAKEFVPTLESNIQSQDSPTALADSESNEIDFFGQISNAVRRRIEAEDDFVAQSPRKGRGDDMDTIFVPAEQEFDEEADQRPHELEVETEAPISKDCNKSLSQISDIESDANIRLESPEMVDHGPETLVDMAVDSDINELTEQVSYDKENHLMKQSIYLTNDEDIENVLNSVQPIPTEIDSVDNSFTEELSNAALANHTEKNNVEAMERPNDILVGDKELLQVEEKEHISKSPSTEEFQFNLQTQNMDVLSHLSELNDASIMQESLYVNHNVDQNSETVSENKDCSAITDALNPLEGSDNLLDLKGNENELYASHSSAADEKHLLEDTKETQANQDISCIDHLMGEMKINDNGKQSQADENETESHSLNNDDHETLESVQKNRYFEDNMNVDELPTKDETKGEHSFVVNEETLINDGIIEKGAPIINSSEHDAFNSEMLSDSKEDIEILQQVEQKEIPSTDNLCERIIVDERVADNSTDAVGEPMLKAAATLDDINVLEDLEEIQDKSVDEIVEPADKEQTCLEEHKELVSNVKCIDNISSALSNRAEEEIISEKRNEIMPQEHVETPIDPHTSNKDFSTNIETTNEPYVNETTATTVELPTESHPENLIIEKSVEPPTRELIDDAELKMPANEDALSSHLNDEVVTAQVEAPKEFHVNKEPLKPLKEKALASVACAAADLATDKASQPVGSSNNIKPVNNKPGVKTTGKPLNTRTTPLVRPAAKKLPTNEIANKTNVLVSKPRPAPLKSTTTASATSAERKVTKPSSAPSTGARKPLASSAAMTPKVPSKPNITPRTTTSAASTTKTTASKPVTASRSMASASTSTARKPTTATGTSATTKPRPATTSAVSSKPNTLTSSGIGATKQSATSPRPTLSAHVRKTTTTATTAKSPIKSSVTSSLSKTSTSSVGARPKPTTSSTSVGVSSTIKTTTTRAAPTSRRLTVGGSTVSSTTTTKTINARNSSPIKPTAGKAQTKRSTPSTNSTTKSAIQPKSSKPIEKKTNEAVAINGDVSSNNKNDTSIVNGISPEPLSSPGDKAALVVNEDFNCSNPTKSENIDQLQENLIGAFDH